METGLSNPASQSGLEAELSYPAFQSGFDTGLSNAGVALILDFENWTFLSCPPVWLEDKTVSSWWL